MEFGDFDEEITIDWVADADDNDDLAVTLSVPGTDPTSALTSPDQAAEAEPISLSPSTPPQPVEVTEEGGYHEAVSAVPVPVSAAPDPGVAALVPQATADGELVGDPGPDAEQRTQVDSAQEAPQGLVQAESEPSAARDQQTISSTEVESHDPGSLPPIFGPSTPMTEATDQGPSLDQAPWAPPSPVLESVPTFEPPTVPHGVELTSALTTGHTGQADANADGEPLAGVADAEGSAGAETRTDAHGDDRIDDLGAADEADSASSIADSNACSSPADFDWTAPMAPFFERLTYDLELPDEDFLAQSLATTSDTVLVQKDAMWNLALCLAFGSEKLADAAARAFFRVCGRHLDTDGLEWMLRVLLSRASLPYGIPLKAGHRGINVLGTCCPHELLDRLSSIILALLSVGHTRGRSGEADAHH
jgi:hypothetical protein